MKRYLRVYRVLLRLNFEALIVYPANFYNGLIASLVWGFFSLYSIVLLTGQTNGAFGWSRNELLLLNGIYGIVIGIFHMFFSFNFDRFSSVIHKGDLDGILLKPMDSQFLLSFWLFGWVTILRILISWGYVLVILHMLSIHVTLIHVGEFTVLGLFGILLLYSIWYLVITLTIWYTRLSNLVELMFNITGIARYPRQMLVQSAGYALWFLFPFLLIINIPTKVYLDKLEFTEILLLLMLSIGLYMCSRKFWKFALRYYGSASS